MRTDESTRLLQVWFRILPQMQRLIGARGFYAHFRFTVEMVGCLKTGTPFQRLPLVDTVS